MTIKKMHADSSEPEPLISIFCFCKNSVGSMTRSIESVLAQMETYPHIEYVVQDGVSTDGTLEILQSYAPKFGGRMKLISEPDQSPTDAFLKALKRCNGSIIGSCLSDEALLPHAVAKVAECFREHPDAGVIHGDIYNTDSDGNIRSLNPSGDFDLEKYLCNQLPMHWAASFFRANALMKVTSNLERNLLSDDFIYWVRLSLFTKIVHIPEVLAKYAIRPDQISERPDVLINVIANRTLFIEEFLSGPDAPDKIKLKRTEILRRYYSWAVNCLNGKNRADEAAKYADRLHLLENRQAGYSPVSSGITSASCISALSLPAENKTVTTTHSEKGRAKIRLLLIYSLPPSVGKITLPEWIKETLRRDFADEVETFACGPGNEISFPDTVDFYDRVARLVDDMRIDAVWDIEGGAVSMDFLFKRFPVNVRVPRIFWAIDTHQYLAAQSEKAQYFDLVFSAQKDALAGLGPHARWLPAGASLYEVDYNLPRDIDVAFVGHIAPGVHDRRKTIIDLLKKEIPGFQVFSHVFLSDKARLVSRMKIMINVSLKNDINFRVFETLACGAMLITDRIHGNGMEDLFEEGNHLVCFDTPEELVEKVRYYLSHDDERLRIARAGQDHVLKNFTHKSIVRKALSAIEQLIADAGVKEDKLTDARCWCGGNLRPSVHPLYSQCESCRTLVVSELPEADNLKNFYTFDHYWHDEQVNVSKYPAIEQRSENDFQDRIPAWHQILSRYNTAPEHLLEIGCSHGGFLKYCLDHGAQNVVGVEVDEGTCAFARKRFGLPHVVSGLFPDVLLPFEKYDMIVGFDVIEHFTDPVKGISSVASRLKENGRFIFQTPCYRGESAAWAQFRAREHVFLYDEKNIRQLFDRCGLQIREILPGFFRDDMFVIGHLKRPVKRILVVRPDSIGDAILTTPILPHIKAAYPQAAVTVLCQNHIRELFESSPDVDAVIGFDRRRAFENPDYQKDLVRHLREQHFDLALNPLYSRDPLCDFLAINSGALSGIAFNGNLCNISAGDRDTNNRFYTTIIPDSEDHKSELERNRDFLEGIGIAAPKLEPVISLTPADEAFADKFFKDHDLNPASTIGLFAGAQNAMRAYEHYGRALSEVCKHDGLSVIGLGGPGDADINRRNLEATGARTVNLSGQATLRQTAAVLKRCRLAVGAETGLAHMACAVGTPNVILLGGGHFGRFMPYSPLTSIVCLPLDCYNCNWKCAFSRSHCVKDVHPDVLSEAIRQTLAGKSDKGRVFVQGISLWEQTPDKPRWQSFHHALNLSEIDIIPVGQVSDFVERFWRTLASMSGVEQARFCSSRIEELIRRGEKLFSENDSKGAESSFLQAVELGDSSAVALNNLGVLYAAMGDHEKALYYYEAAAKSRPDNMTFLKNLGEFHYVVRNDVEKALQWYIKGLSLNPCDTEILMIMGNISIEMGQYDNAGEFYQKVAEIDASNAEAAKILDLLNGNRRDAEPLQDAETRTPSARPEREYLVSAIVSVYNSERFIRGCLDDLEAQTIADRLEIVIVDSGSSQNERAIIEEYTKKYSNIKYIRTEERETVYAAWNRAITASSGRYITNANTDDRHRRDAFAVMASELDKRPDIALVYADVIITEKENETFDRHTPIGYFHWFEWDRTSLLEKGCFIGPQPMWRRSVHDEYGYFDGTMVSSGDYEFWLRISQTHSFYHIKERLGLYLKSPESIEHRNAEKAHRENQQILALYRDAADKGLVLRRTPPAKCVAPTETYLVSAIVSTYNAEPFLRGCLENLEAQSIADRLEIIVVDSGSQQNEEAVVREFQQRFDNIVYIRTDERESVYKAWNRGIRAARGKYITNANTDDRRYPDGIEILVKALDDRPDIALAYGNFRITDTPNADPASARIIEDMDYPPYSRGSLLVSCYPGPMPVWRKSLHDEFGYFNENYLSAGDREFWCRISQKYDLLNVQAFIGVYLSNPEGIENVNKRAGIVQKEAVRILQRYAHSFDRPWADYRPIHLEMDGGFLRIRDEIGKLEASGGGFCLDVTVKRATLDEYLWLKTKQREGLISRLLMTDDAKKLLPSVAVLFFTYDRLEYTKQALAAMMANTAYPFKLYIVDNHSTDGTVEWLQEFRAKYADVVCDIRYNPINEGLAGPTNAFWERADADLVGKVDNDTLVPEGWLERLVEAHVKIPRLAVVGGWHFRPEDFDAASASRKIVHENGVDILPDTHIGGCCYLMKASIQRELGSMQYNPALKIHGWTEYQHLLGKKGYLVGYLYPLLQLEYMDDPRSAKCLIDEKYRDYTRRIWRERGVEFSSTDQITGWLKRDAGRITAAADYYGFARPEVQSLVPAGARRVLDVGCGSGQLGKALKDSRAVYVAGIEIVPEAAREAAGVLDKVYQADAASVLSEIESGGFDTVIMADVLEHVADTAAMLNDARRLLERGGRLILSVPNIRHWSVLKNLIEGHFNYEEAGILDRTHLRFFTRESILRALAAAGFTVETLSGTVIEDVAAPQAFVDACRRAGLETQTLEQEAQIYQYLIVAKPAASAIDAATGASGVGGLTSIVILTLNELDYTQKCVKSIRTHTPEAHEIIFVDNGSTDGTVAWLRKQVKKNKHYKLIANEQNLGFSRGCNQGIEASEGEFVLLLNNDVVVSDGWLSGLIECLRQSPNAGIVGPMTNRISGPQQIVDDTYRSADDLDAYAKAFRQRFRHRRIPYRRIVGFCMLLRRSLIDRIGPLDESFGTGNFEDDDLCLRAALEGLTNYIAGDVFIHHFGSRSFIGNRIDYGSTISGNRNLLKNKWTLNTDTPEGRKLSVLKAVELAEELYFKGETDQAVQALVDCIKTAPDAAGIYTGMARMFLETKRFGEAWAALEAMPEAAKSELQSLEYAGYAKEGLGEDDEAAEYVRKMLSRNENYAPALNLRGVLNFKKEEKARAAEWFEKAAAADSGYGEPQTNLGVLCWGLEKKEEAPAHLQKGFNLAPTSPDAASLYYSVVSAVERYDEAEADFDAAVKLYPDHRNLVFLYIDLLIRREKFASAMPAIEDALAKFGPSDETMAAALTIREKVGLRRIDKKAKQSSLSLCMIVRNEEKNLLKCLRSIRDVVDEMIVVDTGSTDKTKDIARVFGAKIYDFVWTGDFSAARNYSLAQAQGDWILVLDADETVSALDYRELQSLLRKKDAPSAAYSLVTRNYITNSSVIGWKPGDGKYPDQSDQGWMESAKVRLFPRSKNVSFVNPVHEIVEPSLSRAGIPIFNCSVVVHHYGKLDLNREAEKGREYYELGKTKYESDPTNVKYINELARQAHLLGKYEEAKDLWLKLLGILEGDPRSPGFAEIARVTEGDPLSDIRTQLAAAYLGLNQFPEALAAARKSLAAPVKPAGRVYFYALAEILAGSWEAAVKELESVLSQSPDYLPALFLKAVVCVLKNEREKAGTLFEILRQKQFDLLTPRINHLLGQLRFAGKIPEAGALAAAAIENKIGNDETVRIYTALQADPSGPQA